MLLTKKNIAKIAFMAILYFLLGSFSFAAGIYFYSLGVHGNDLFIIGAVVYALCPLVALWGRYAEGTAKMLNRYNKLVGQQLKPAEFIKEYEDLKASPELVVCKPGYNLLGCLCAAYECLNEHERALEIADEAISVAGKKKPRAMLLKVSLLFSCGKTEEAESLLITTAMPLAEIAALCGFEEYNYFSRTFKKVTGMSPRQYRAMYTGA